MERLFLSKHMLFYIAVSLFIGCAAAGQSMLSSFVVLPIVILLCLYIFINRHKPTSLIAPLLVLIFLTGFLLYNFTATRSSRLQSFAGEAVVVQGVVCSEPVETDYGYKLQLKDIYFINNNKTFNSNERLQLYIGKEDKLKFGDKIKASVQLEPIAKLRNFGDFNFEKYYKSKNIYLKAYPLELTKLAENAGGYIPTLLYRCNERIRTVIFSAMPSTEAALLYGILTGSKSDIDDEVMEVFSLTGLAHILSVSGLHIGFLVMLLNFILKPFKLSKKLHGGITFSAALFYILLIGAPVPAVRALLMLTVLLAGGILGRQYNLITSASFAAVLQLLYNPLIIHDPSFIISYACIYSIGFLQKPLSNALRFMPGLIRSSFALSIAVWIGITPVLVYYFNYVSVINILLNLLAVPIAFVITLAGFVAVVLGILLPPVAIFVFAASYYMIKLLYFISEKSLLLPMTGFNVPSLGMHIYLIYYSAVLMLVEDFWSLKRLRFKRNYITALGIGLCVAIALYLIPSSYLRIYFVDVGQGDCSVIKTPDNKVIVVDGGGSSDWQKSTYDLGKKLTVPAILHLGVWSVDTVIVSHIHDDHLAGLLPVLESFRVKQVVLPASDRYGEGEFTSEKYNRLIQLCKEKNIPIKYLKEGSRITASGITLDILAPRMPYIEGTTSDINNNSLVFKLSYKSFDGIFTGDIQREAEETLLELDIECDMLKVAHHGSPYSSIQEFISKADPEVSIISVGKNNYGHPSKEVIDRLKSVESRVYRTDMSGAVMLATNGQNIKIRTVR
jgi:competence protein ComEC